MYINITGSSNNKDVYIYQSFRKENGKTSSHIYKKLGKMNDLLAQFDNDKEKMICLLYTSYLFHSGKSYMCWYRDTTVRLPEEDYT